VPPPLYLSGFGAKAIELAGRIGDGFVSVQPESDHIAAFRAAGGAGKPTQAGLKVCWGPDEQDARDLLYRLWPNEGIPGQAAQLLPLPAHFAELADLVDRDALPHACGPDPEVHVEAIKAYVDAGFEEIHIAQVGPDQKGFFDFYQREVLPRVRDL